MSLCYIVLVDELNK